VTSDALVKGQKIRCARRSRSLRARARLPAISVASERAAMLDVASSGRLRSISSRE
jgi:hypothetical protein